MGAAFWLLFILHQVHNTITFNHCIKNCIPVPCGKHPRLSCSCLCGEILKSHTTCLQNFTLFEQAKGHKQWYIYLEPVCPLFWGLNPPKEGPFHSKQGSFGFQVYNYNSWPINVHSLHIFYTYKWHIAFRTYIFFFLASLLSLDVNLPLFTWNTWLLGF